jgi:hypothetical protein
MALQIDADMNYQRRAWAFQRFGWLLIAALVLAALFGLFGGGPLSSASAEGVRVRLDYDRFARLGQSTKLRLSFMNAPSTRLELSRAYLDSFRIEQITPAPRATDGNQDWLGYSFAGEGSMTVAFDLIPETFGTIRGAIRGSGETLLFRQLVYP